MREYVANNLYFVFLLVGLLLVGANAHGVYSKPGPRDDAKWLSDEVKLQVITGRQQFVMGYFVYLVPILLVYLLLSVSPELLTLTMSITGASTSVGAMTLSGLQQHTFAPVFAATAVIALCNVYPFSKLEQLSRRMSHSVAGVPEHIQELILRIRKVELSRSDSADQDDDSDSGLRTRRENLAHEQDLATIDTLHDWTYGNTGSLIWSEQARSVLDMYRSQIDGDKNVLKRKLALHTETDDTGRTDVAALREQEHVEIGHLANELKDQYRQLLAMLVASYVGKSPGKLIDQRLEFLISTSLNIRLSIGRINELASSTLTAFLMCLPIITMAYLTIHVVSQLTYPNVVFHPGSGQLLVAGESMETFFWSGLLTCFEAALSDTFAFCLMFYAACLAGLTYRLAQLKSNQWEVWETHSQPVGQYLLVAVLASLSAGLAFVVYLLIKLVIWPSSLFMNTGHFSSMLNDFGTQYVKFGMMSLVVVPWALLVSRLSDHLDDVDNGTRQSTLNAGLVYGLAIFASAIAYVLLRVYLGNVSRPVDMLFGTLVTVFTFFVLAMSFSLTEKKLIDLHSPEGHLRIKNSAGKTVKTQKPAEEKPDQTTSSSQASQSRVDHGNA